MIDELPRIGLFREAGLGDVPLLVPKPLIGFQAESLELVGVPSQQLIGVPLSPDPHVRPERLVWAQPAAVTGYRPHRPHADWVCAWLRNELREVLSETRGRRL
ncbi:MAG: hypothetical protein ACR2NO_09805 [Chloroflexota bacterium]